MILNHSYKWQILCDYSSIRYTQKIHFIPNRRAKLLERRLKDNLKATKKIQYHKNNIFVHMHDVSYNRKPHSIESTDKSNLNNTKQISQISQNDIFIQINHTMIKKLTF